MRKNCQHVDVAGAYVLDELNDHQRSRFERHVRLCEICADELDLLRRAYEAPALLAHVHIAPVMARHPRSAPAPAVELRRLDGRAGQAELGAVHPPSKRSHGISGRKPKWMRGRRLVQPMPKPAMVGLACLLLVAVITVAMSRIGASTTFVRGNTAWPTSVGIALKLDGGANAELLTLQLPDAPLNEHYEVWALRRGSGVTALTMLEQRLVTDANGDAGVNLPGDIRGYRLVAIYAEPDRGAVSITTGDHPVAVVDVPPSG